MEEDEKVKCEGESEDCAATMRTSPGVRCVAWRVLTHTAYMHAEVNGGRVDSAAWNSPCCRLGIRGGSCGRVRL